MKIAEFNDLPLMSKVKYKGKQYVLRDKDRNEHTAVITKGLGSGGLRVIRCSEISLI